MSRRELDNEIPRWLGAFNWLLVAIIYLGTLGVAAYAISIVYRWAEWAAR